MTDARSAWRAAPDGVVIGCRLTPKGGRDAIDGVKRLADGSSVLMARVRSAPQDGEANRALCALLADRLGARASDTRVLAGAKSRLKQVAIFGDAAALIAKLESLSTKVE